MCHRNLDRYPHEQKDNILSKLFYPLHNPVVPLLSFPSKVGPGAGLARPAKPAGRPATPKARPGPGCQLPARQLKNLEKIMDFVFKKEKKQKILTVFQKFFKVVVMVSTR